ncbi:MAG TPA: hypothetical protein DDY78_07120 [Planctomycetales bacterium]|nr:hypothetical protein [Planctomycetales bacterium]
MVTIRPLGAIRSVFFLSLILSFFGYFSFSAGSDDKQPAPRLATIQGQHLPLKTVLAELDRQTSNVVIDQIGESNPVLDLDLKEITFWQALDAIAEKARARVDIHPRDGGVALAKRQAGWHPPLISYSGLFRTTLNSISAKLDLETGARHYIGSLEVAWEPHLLPLLLETRPRSLAVRDDAGRSIGSDSFASSLAPVDGRTSLAFEVTLPPVARSVNKLSLLEGQLYAVAPSKMLTLAFDSLDQLIKAPADDARRKLTQEGVVCRVSKVVAADDHWSVEITLDYPDGNVKLDSYQSWVVNNEIRLESKDGADHFPSSSYLLEESTPRHAVLTYHFNDKERMKRGLAEWKLVYRTPALVVKVPIAFSFKDVPLP